MVANGDRPQRPWVQRLWREVPQPRQRPQARGQRQGHRRAARLGGHAARPRREPGRGDRRLLWRLHGAGDHDPLFGSPGGGGEPVWHLQLDQLSGEHRSLPPRQSPS